MARESISAPWYDFSQQNVHLLEALYAESRGEQWGLPREAFAQGLRRSAEKRFRGAQPKTAELDIYLKSLHLQDLALACACNEGIEVAWEFFVAYFRQELRDASRAILRSSGSADEASAEELADSLYAELYGIRSAGGAARKSLFEYFHGRSKLSTWLRAVLSQRYVDLLRTSRGTISLDTAPVATKDEAELKIAQQIGQRTDAVSLDPDREKYLARFDHALSVALGRLTPRERLLLACYYVDQLTLAAIGRLFGKHESTVSRQLERTRCTLRETVVAILRGVAPMQDGHAAESALDESQVQLAFEYALEDWPFDLSRALSKAEAAADPPEK